MDWALTAVCLSLALTTIYALPPDKPILELSAKQQELYKYGHLQGVLIHCADHALTQCVLVDITSPRICEVLQLKQASLIPNHIIKTRSIDLNNAHGLAMESRLEKVLWPTLYRLELEPYLEDGVFKGHVSINVTWLQDADQVSIHCAHELQITAYEVRALIPAEGKEPQKIAVKRLTMDPKKPVATLHLEKVVPMNSTGHLDFSFSGNMETASMEGFFKTTYVEQEVERIVVATQLRPNNARRLFPCFDEPTYRTHFYISVVRPRNMVALGNMFVQRSEDIPGEPNAVRDHFERTPPIPTYTVGLVIADLKQLNTSRNRYYDGDYGKIELRVWGRPEFLQALDNLDERVERVFNELAVRWDVPLPVGKVDFVALPNYQGVKPADNLGLIVFRESDLANKGYYHLAQEINYQWFGIITAPDWWSHAHINKAIAGYVAAETAFKINGGTEMEGKWPMTLLYSLYYEFSKRYPHSRITGMKQETACTKIELLFRMFNFTLGADTFHEALLLVLEGRKYETFTSNDVWNILNARAHHDGKLPKEVNVTIVANSWIEKDRLPLVTAKRDYEARTLSLTQKIYLRERPHDVPDADRMSWWAPIVVVRQDNLDFRNTRPLVWMKDRYELKINNMPSKEYFIIVNPEEIAPFPVNYDKRNWELISQFLLKGNRTAIPELTRAKVVHDAWNLAFAGELGFDTAFDMTLFMVHERNHIVWDPIFTMIDHIGRHIWPIHEKFQAYVRMMLGTLHNDIKEESETEESYLKNLRSMTLTFLCQAGFKPCVTEAQQQFSKWMEAKNPDAGNPIANQYICPVFKYGTKKEWEFGLQRVMNFPHSRKQSERTYLLKTLAGCPVDEWKIMRLLNITVLESNGNFSETDLFLIFSMLSGNAPGYTTLFNFLSANWDVLKEKFQSRTNLWDNLITSATSQFTTKAGLELVSNLYVAHQGEFGSAEHIIEKSMRNIREEVKWSDENLPIIEKWLDNFLASSGLKDDQAYQKL